MVSDQEWKILGADELSEESLAAKKHEIWMRKNDAKMAVKKKKKKTKKRQVKVKEDDDGDYDIEDDKSEDEEAETTE